MNPVRVFEAAARHQSFKAAADELFVTQGAVSRQIKALEDHYGVALFHRRHRRVALTPEGQLLLPAFSEALDRIAQASDRLKGAQRELQVKAVATFTVRWLMPRLYRFEAAHPEIQLRLTTGPRPVDFSSEVFDAGVVYGEYDRPDVKKDLILTEWMEPVCAPPLLAGAGPMPPAALKQRKLILNTPHGRDWRLWAEAIRVDGLPFDAALKFNHDDAAIQAAVAGHGIALANLNYVGEELRLGSLVRAVDRSPVKIGAHYLVSPAHLADSPRVAAFRDWLLDEAARMEMPADGPGTEPPDA